MSKSEEKPAIEPETPAAGDSNRDGANRAHLANHLSFNRYGQPLGAAG